MKLNDQMNTGNFARHSFFFINQVKKSPVLKASKIFVLFLLFFLSFSHSFITFSF